MGINENSGYTFQKDSYLYYLNLGAPGLTGRFCKQDVPTLVQL